MNGLVGRAGALALVALGTLGTLVGGCSKSDCADSDKAALVDPLLLGFISRARAAHHKADLREADGDLAGARIELEAIVKGPFPPQEGAAEVREVLADTRARLADLRSRSGDFDGALADVAKGLGLVPEPSYFRGHLLETQGLVEERRWTALLRAGNAEAAAQAKERALAAFDEAMRIQAAVIDAGSPER